MCADRSPLCVSLLIGMQHQIFLDLFLFSEFPFYSYSPLSGAFRIRRLCATKIVLWIHLFEHFQSSMPSLVWSLVTNRWMWPTLYQNSHLRWTPNNSDWKLRMCGISLSIVLSVIINGQDQPVALNSYHTVVILKMKVHPSLMQNC